MKQLILYTPPKSPVNILLLFVDGFGNFLSHFTLEVVKRLDTASDFLSHIRLSVNAV